jgi:anaerobic selenocysteine-containing dehydrogenase
MDLPRQIRTGDPYPLRAMVAFGLNHRMFPGSDRFLESLQELDFICDVDLFATDSSRWADIVLPACSSVERSELRAYPEKWITLTEPAIAPLGESRSDTDVVFDLAQRLGLDDPLLNPEPDGGADPATVFPQVLDWILEPSGMTMDEIGSHPGGMPVRDPLPAPDLRYLERGFPTPSGKMEFASSILERLGPGIGVDALPTWTPPGRGAEAQDEPERDHPFILNAGSRLPMFIHSRTYRLPWTRSLRPHPAADINPADARALGIVQGDRIELSTPAGSIRVLANLTEMVRPGDVHMYHSHPVADVNLLLDPDALDPVSGFPGYRSARCRVDKVREHEAPRASAREEVRS